VDVGGRGFGAVLMYLLMAGEVYTTFSFLGASGWLFPWRSNPVHHGLPHLGLLVSFFILPQIWEVARSTGCRPNPISSACVTATSGWPHLVCVVVSPSLSLTAAPGYGLGIIVSIASFDGVRPYTCHGDLGRPLGGLFLPAALRAVAWVSVLKDVLMVFARSPSASDTVYSTTGHRPHVRCIGTRPAGTPDHGRRHRQPGPHVVRLHGPSDFVGFYMWAARIWAAFTAKSGDTLRRNAVVMPLYTITLAFVFFAGFTAVLVVPGLPNGDLSLLTIVRKSFPPGFWA